MARVFISVQLRKLTDGKRELQIPGATLREVIDNLEAAYPGTKARITEGDDLRPGMMAIVGQQATRQGLLQKIEDDATEVHFLPAVAGG